MGWGSYPSLNFDELCDLGKVPSPPWACLPPSVKQKDIYGFFQLALPGSQHLLPPPVRRRALALGSEKINLGSCSAVWPWAKIEHL